MSKMLPTFVPTHDAGISAGLVCEFLLGRSYFEARRACEQSGECASTQEGRAAQTRARHRPDHDPLHRPDHDPLPTQIIPSLTPFQKHGSIPNELAANYVILQSSTVNRAWGEVNIFIPNALDISNTAAIRSSNVAMQKLQYGNDGFDIASTQERIRAFTFTWQMFGHKQRQLCLSQCHSYVAMGVGREQRRHASYGCMIRRWCSSLLKSYKPMGLWIRHISLSHKLLFFPSLSS